MSVDDILNSRDMATEKAPDWNPGQCYSGHELILLATELEKRGWLFYRHAQGLADTREAGELFKRMAQEELDHIKILNEQIKPLIDASEDNSWMNDQAVADYLVGALEMEVIPDRDEAHRLLEKVNTQDEALALCLEGERNSVMFYENMLQSVMCSKAREAVERILAMEHDHMASLDRLKK